MEVVDKVLGEVEALMEKLEGIALHEFAVALAAVNGDAAKVKEAFISKGANL